MTEASEHFARTVERRLGVDWSSRGYAKMFDELIERCGSIAILEILVSEAEASAHAYPERYLHPNNLESTLRQVATSSTSPSNRRVLREGPLSALLGLADNSHLTVEEGLSLATASPLRVLQRLALNRSTSEVVLRALAEQDTGEEEVLKFVGENPNCPGDLVVQLTFILREFAWVLSERPDRAALSLDSSVGYLSEHHPDFLYGAFLGRGVAASEAAALAENWSGTLAELLEVMALVER